MDLSMDFPLDGDDIKPFADFLDLLVARGWITQWAVDNRHHYAFRWTDKGVYFRDIIRQIDIEIGEGHRDFDFMHMVCVIKSTGNQEPGEQGTRSRPLC